MSNFRERLLQTRTRDVSDLAASNDNEPEKIEPFERSDFYGVEHVKNVPVCLELRFRSGVSRAMPYSFILEISYDPEAGIEIKTTMKTITIIGRNLKSLYLSLVAYRISYISENIGNDLTPENKLFVREIKLEEN